MDLSIGVGGKSSHSKGLQDLGSLAAKQLCSLEDSVFPSTNGRGLKINLSKAKVRFSGEGSDLSDSVKSLVSTAEKTAGLPRSQGYLLPRNDMGKKVAFTLAEVLITLGIIGVVAAMTLPTLIANYEKKVTATKAKKAYSELLNAIKMSEAHNGEMKEWTYPESASIEITRSFVEEYIKPYFNGLKECSVGYDDSCGMSLSWAGVNYILPNGTALSMVIQPVGKFYVTVDTNGKGQPNTLGHDKFYFSTNNTNKNLLPYGWKENLTKEDIVNGYTDDFGTFISCKKTKGDNENELHRHGCTALLMLNNWEIDKDYPW